MTMMLASELEGLIRLLSRLPGLGPRSSQRLALALIEKRETFLEPLIKALETVADHVSPCGICGNLDGCEPCAICSDPDRDHSSLCVVESVADLWALERAGAHRGHYHVLGGVLSAIEGLTPEDLTIEGLLQRVEKTRLCEVILALNLTIDSQITAHYLAQRLEARGARLTRLAHGVPVGGELNWLDEGTLTTAINERRSFR